jgi:hypothetical protein
VSPDHISNRGTIFEEEPVAILSDKLLFEYPGREPSRSHKYQGWIGTILIQRELDLRAIDYASVLYLHSHLYRFLSLYERTPSDQIAPTLRRLADLVHFESGLKQ